MSIASEYTSFDWDNLLLDHETWPAYFEEVFEHSSEAARCMTRVPVLYFGRGSKRAGRGCQSHQLPIPVKTATESGETGHPIGAKRRWRLNDWLSRSRGYDRHSIVRRHLRVSRVDLWLVPTRTDHPNLWIIGNHYTRTAPEKLKCPYM
jgi:hypothetical protein